MLNIFWHGCTMHDLLYLSLDYYHVKTTSLFYNSDLHCGTLGSVHVYKNSIFDSVKGCIGIKKNENFEYI